MENLGEQYDKCGHRVRLTAKTDRKMKMIKVIFVTMEIISILCVICFAFSESAESSMGHWFRAAYISLFAVFAVVMQREQQAIEWDEE